MRTASLATIDYASKYREELLYNRYQAAATRSSVTEGTTVRVHHPQAHTGSDGPVELLRRMAFNACV